MLLIKLIKFCIVGCSGLILDFLTTWILKEKIKINKYLSNSIGFLIAATSNYIINRVWTFNSLNSNLIEEYSIFIFISSIGLLINNTILFITHDKLYFKFYTAKVIAIIVTTVWNFTGNYFYTFSN